MAAIGNSPTQQAFTPAIDYFSGNGSTTAFTLSRPVASVAQVQVTIDNVAQNPSSAYTVSANTITFTSAPLSGTNNIYVYYTSPITQVIAPGQGTVTATSMASSTGTGAGVFQTSPTINTPTLASANITTALTLTGASGTNGQFLTSAGTSAAPTWTTVANTVFMRYSLGTDQSLTDATITVVNFTGTPSIQIGGTWDTTNKRFTASSTTAGYYLVNFNAQFFSGSNAGYNASGKIYKNGGVAISNEMTINGSDIRHASISVSDIIYLANTDYFDFRVSFDITAGTPILSGDTFFNFQRLIY